MYKTDNLIFLHSNELMTVEWARISGRIHINADL
jgi:hypothetical protein